MDVDPPSVPGLSIPPPEPFPFGPPPARPPAILRQTARNRGVVFGFVAIVSAAALVRGVLGATTGGGRLAVAVLFGGILIGTVVVWVLLGRNPLELQVWDDRIVLAPATGPVTLAPLTRAGGPVELARRWVLQQPTWGVHQPATDGWLPLDLFDVKAVGAALAERGWLMPRA